MGPRVIAHGAAPLAGKRFLVLDKPDISAFPFCICLLVRVNSV